MIKLVYLDSSDFSNLSLPDEELSSENQTILSVLREHKQAGTAKFFMSAIHFSEAVHSARQHKQAAVRRAHLMRELCGTNLLRFPTEIPKLELKRALIDESSQLSVDEITSRRGEWFDFDWNLDYLAQSRENMNRRIDDIPDTSLEKIVKCCPSLFTYLQTSKEYMLSIAASHVARIRAGNVAVKKIEPSDYGDLMHCFYAPYFDIFRCDVRFGAHLKKHSPIRGKIADRIGDLLRMLPELSTQARSA